jgi:hypothetical protein
MFGPEIQAHKIKTQEFMFHPQSTPNASNNQGKHVDVFLLILGSKSVSVSQFSRLPTVADDTDEDSQSESEEYQGFIGAITRYSRGKRRKRGNR